MPLPRPGLCEVCRRWARARLCADCLGRFATPVPRCRRCGLRRPGTDEAAATDCGDCLRDPPPFDRAVCALDYAFPWDALLSAFKFHAAVDLAPALAARLSAALAAAPAGPRVDWVLPVPLSAQRLRERGYNQAWEIARRVARTAGLPARAGLLERLLHTAPQAGLAGRAQRLRNLRAAFAVPPAASPLLRGRRVALVDDVMTTGATLREAAGALLRGGAGAVEVWAVARTPQDG